MTQATTRQVKQITSDGLPLVECSRQNTGTSTCTGRCSAWQQVVPHPSLRLDSFRAPRLPRARGERFKLYRLTSDTLFPRKKVFEVLQQEILNDKMRTWVREEGGRQM